VTLEIPNHIAIIMDGNGRWAQRRGHPRVFGHVRGSSRVKAIVKEANRLGVRALTLYAFSTENWSRPESERRVLWKLLKKYLVRDAEELHKQNVRLRVIGEIDRLDEDVKAVLFPTVQKLSKNTGLQLTFALSYGSRCELARAAQLFAQDCLAGKVRPEMMNESLFEKYLWTADFGELSEVDLFIRTSGEQRVSNFLLWQSAYAELVFMDVCWPDFEPKDLEAAIEAYSKRERRFGGLGPVRSSSKQDNGAFA
jgi:undecaprenyl diphosphate synthase